MSDLIYETPKTEDKSKAKPKPKPKPKAPKKPKVEYVHGVPKRPHRY